jgi:hypothetical protein
MGIFLFGAEQYFDAGFVCLEISFPAGVLYQPALEKTQPLESLSDPAVQCGRGDGELFFLQTYWGKTTLKIWGCSGGVGVYSRASKPESSPRLLRSLWFCISTGLSLTDQSLI